MTKAAELEAQPGVPQQQPYYPHQFPWWLSPQFMFPAPGHQVPPHPMFFAPGHQAPTHPISQYFAASCAPVPTAAEKLDREPLEKRNERDFEQGQSRNKTPNL